MSFPESGAGKNLKVWKRDFLSNLFSNNGVNTKMGNRRIRYVQFINESFLQNALFRYVFNRSLFFILPQFLVEYMYSATLHGYERTHMRIAYLWCTTVTFFTRLWNTIATSGVYCLQCGQNSHK